MITDEIDEFANLITARDSGPMRGITGSWERARETNTRGMSANLKDLTAEINWVTKTPGKTTNKKKLSNKHFQSRGSSTNMLGRI